MNRRLHRTLLRRVLKTALVLALFASLFALGTGAEAGDHHPLQEDAGAFFQWWDALGLPNFKDVPFVRYRPGWGRSAGGPDDGWDQGFLLAETNQTFTVLGTDLWTRRWDKATPGDVAPPTHFERADLAATVQFGLALLSGTAARTPRADPFVFERIDWQPATYRVLVLARACAARGLSDAALSLLPLAIEGGSVSDPTGRLKRWQDLTRRAALMAAEGRFEDPGASWLDIRREFERWSSGPDASSRAADTVALIDRTVVAERDYAARKADRDTRSGTYYVADLIAALRPYGGSVLMDLDVARVSGHEASSAAERLRKLGRAAVPLLIEALADDTYVRHVSTFQGRFRRGMRLDRVRDVALAILDDISGHALDKVRMTAKITPADWSVSIAEVKRWWAAEVAVSGPGK